MKSSKVQDENQNQFDPNEIEARWQKEWEESGLFSPDMDEGAASAESSVEPSKQPFYNLMMFPYPSAEGLHVGNMYSFTGADVYARFNRMQGKDVFEPIGLDGFGIHSENYALKVGRHPKEQAEVSEKNFYKQLHAIGNSFDWTKTLETYDPEYYRWTQWLFVQLFKAGLAYRDTALVNWCPKDLTVLSDEQVIDGKCERCGSEVSKKELEQWFFRITKYADRLLNNIEGLNWSEKVKIAQKNWIGKSEGAEIEFKVQNSKLKVNVFTTRPDTLFGATFLVLSPEHELVNIILNSFQNLGIPKQVRDEVSKYVDKTKNETEIERTAEGKEKTGVITGLYAINPVNSKKIPILVADYVLSGYGTGAIMAVPAHDQRDFETANKFNMPIIPVIQPKLSIPNSEVLTSAFEGEGIIIGSDQWNGFHVPSDIPKVIDWLEKEGIGVRKANYHLRDWLISRQRYWGPPIPMIFCSNCQKYGKAEVEGMEGWFTVPVELLPVLLPNVSDWKPMGTGKAPLANHPEFFKTTCPSCGGEAIRETDVSDTFLDSSWYFLRYPSTDIETSSFDIDITKKWLPVNMYIGGAEHAVLHLLYSRFVTMALYDLGFLSFEEPFSNFFAHGLIIKDGAKMSKSKGNVVVPDEYIKKYGADSLRTYLMFLGPYEDGGDFKDSGIEGMYKFLKKVWRLLAGAILSEAKDLDSPATPQNDSERTRIMHKTIQKVTKDIKEFGYNTAIAALMEWYNYLNQESRIKSQELSMEEVEVYLKLLAPFAPHMTEELWQQKQNIEYRILNIEESYQNSKFESIHLSSWPVYDEKYLVYETVTLAVQVNGKRRGEFAIGSQEIEDRSLVENKAKEQVLKYLEGLEIKKVIYIPGKIVNFVA